MLFRSTLGSHGPALRLAKKNVSAAADKRRREKDRRTKHKSDGTGTSRSSPVKVTGNATFTSLAPGAYFTCGLTSAMFTDTGVVKSISRGAKIVGGIFAILFIGTEGMALFGY